MVGGFGKGREANLSLDHISEGNGGEAYFIKMARKGKRLRRQGYSA